MNTKENGKGNGKSYEDDWNPFGERTLVGAVNQARVRIAIIQDDPLPGRVRSADGAIARAWMKE